MSIVMKELKRFIEFVLAQIHSVKATDSNFLAGHNGPYRDKETEIRGLAHTIALLSNLDYAEHKMKYQDEVAGLVDKLLSSKNRDGYGTFKQRLKPGKDEVNGVIGIAWVIEGLCCAYRTYENEKAKEFLLSIEEELNFDKVRNLWTRPVGKESKYYNTIDETFNHQLWLAYALVYKSCVLNQEPSQNLRLFFKNIEDSFSVYSSGLVVHAIIHNRGLKRKVRNLLKALRDWQRINLKGQTKKYKENGYHLFNMYAFARMAHLGYDSLFKNSKKFNTALRYCTSQELWNRLNINEDRKDFYQLDPPSGLPFNRYGFPYNVAGFEFLYVKKVFSLDIDESLAKKYWKTQLSCYGLDENADKGYLTEDRANLLLRAYELSFLMIDDKG